ncbi:MAG: S58 family peptidase [Candidatus Latescibacteria bacterium]|nr:S58 family peptidase [Candidatus Latescibacterota bacterium]
MQRRHFLRLGGGIALGGVPVLGACARLAPAQAAAPRVRLRQLGIVIGSLQPGPFNAITDVAGVAVGHVTLIRGEGALVPGQGPVRTGVTAVLPHRGDYTREQLFAADFTLNGNGEMTGLGPVRRTGRLGAPILLTNTSSIGSVYDGAMGHMLGLNPDLFAQQPYPEPLVGETWADYLNDTVGRHVRPEHAVEALEAARSGSVQEGCVGGGTGMRAYQFKAGIGTSSRQAVCRGQTYTVGVLVQANHGRRSQLMVDGVPVGREIPDLLPERGGKTKSLLVVIATDAPLIPIQLQRLCKRAALGMARTGAISTQGSGDLLVAFSTAQKLTEAPVQPIQQLANSQITRLYQGVVEGVEEAILNALTAAYTMTGRDGNTIHALPLERLVDIMRQYGRLK